MKLTMEEECTLDEVVDNYAKFITTTYRSNNEDVKRLRVLITALNHPDELNLDDFERLCNFFLDQEKYPELSDDTWEIISQVINKMDFKRVPIPYSLPEVINF